MYPVSELVAIFKALSNENRLAIFNLLRECCLCEEAPGGLEPENLPEGCLCVQKIVERLSMTQATVSHHLKELARAGLLTRFKKGPWVYYLVNAEVLAELEGYFSGGGGRREAACGP